MQQDDNWQQIGDVVKAMAADDVIASDQAYLEQWLGERAAYVPDADTEAALLYAMRVAMDKIRPSVILYVAGQSRDHHHFIKLLTYVNAAASFPDAADSLAAHAAESFRHDDRYTADAVCALIHITAVESIEPDDDVFEALGRIDRIYRATIAREE